MFEFAWPWIFLLLPLPWIIHRWLPSVDHQASSALRVPFFQKLKQLSHQYQNQPLSHHLGRKKLLKLAAWALLIIATAGPVWLGKAITLPQSGRNIMLAVDLSGSMQIPDMSHGKKQLTRLDVVKAVASQFIKRRDGDRLGLILFGTRAYLQTPLTYDRNTVEQMLQDATIGLAGPETAIGDAIGLAVKRLQYVPGHARILILLTDGGNNSGVIAPIQAAKLAAKLGIKIYTIGIGATRMLIPGIFGPQMINPSNDLDIETLKKIATITHAEFFRAKDQASLEKVYQQLDQLEPIETNKAVFRPQHELYPWPLGAALLLCGLLIWPRFGFSRRHKTALGAAP